MSLNISATNNSNIDHLEKVLHYISTYTFVFYLIFGNIGNIFKVCFFLQKPLKRCPCAIYVLFATISHFFTLNNIPLFNLLSTTWMIISFGPVSSGINGTIIENAFTSSEKTITMCKIRNYFHMWSSNFSFQVLVLASINRFFMTIKKKNQRQKHYFSDFFSSLSTAYRLCFITCVTWALLSIHHFFNITLKHNICSPQNTFLWAIGFTSIHIFQAVLLITFGTLTILYREERAIWIRRRCQNHHEMIPMFNQLCRHCRYERSERHHIETQLTSMIITEIILVILTLLPNTIYIVYRLITVKNYGNSNETFIERLIQLTIFFEPSCGFYIYLCSLTTLKRRFLNVVRRRIGMIKHY